MDFGVRVDTVWFFVSIYLQYYTDLLHSRGRYDHGQTYSPNWPFYHGMWS